MKRHARLLATIALISFALCLVGCIDEKDTVTVYPDGSGTIHLRTVMGKELSEMMLSFSKSPNEAAEQALYGELAKWQGVAAWSPVKGVVENGLITMEATGYFENIAQLKKVDKSSGESYAWAPAPGGGFKLVRSSTGSNTNLPEDDASNEQAKQMLAMMKGFRVEAQFVLPGTITTCTGCTTHTGRSGSIVLTDEDLTKMSAKQDEYQKRIAGKELTREQANAAFQKEMEPLSGNLEITCAPGDVGSEFAQFKKDFDKARADYASSGVADKVQAASGKNN